jgi:hypothetical protein
MHKLDNKPCLHKTAVHRTVFYTKAEFEGFYCGILQWDGADSARPEPVAAVELTRTPAFRRAHTARCAHGEWPGDCRFCMGAFKLGDSCSVCADLMETGGSPCTKCAAR